LGFGFPSTSKSFWFCNELTVSLQSIFTFLKGHDKQQL
jgi:hypothetical protein